MAVFHPFICLETDGLIMLMDLFHTSHAFGTNLTCHCWSGDLHGRNLPPSPPLLAPAASSRFHNPSPPPDALVTQYPSLKSWDYH